MPNCSIQAHSCFEKLINSIEEVHKSIGWFIRRLPNSLHVSEGDGLITAPVMLNTLLHKLVFIHIQGVSKVVEIEVWSTPYVAFIVFSVFLVRILAHTQYQKTLSVF